LCGFLGRFERGSGRVELVGRLSFVSCLLQYLFKIILDRGSLDFRVIGGRDGGENSGRGWMKLGRGMAW